MNTILVFTHFFPPAFEGGGPIRSLEAMVTKYHGSNVVHVVTSARDLRGNLLKYEELEEHKKYPLGTKIIRTTNFWAHIRSIATEVPASNAIYLNSLFDWKFTLLPLLFAACHPSKTRIYIAPRGELDKGALSIKPRKKRAFLSVAQTLGLFKHVTWHSTSAHETRCIENAFSAPTTIELANQVRISPPETLNYTPRTPRRLLFVGRISPVKGLDILLQALNDVPQPVTITIAGTGKTGEEAYQQKCHALASRLDDHIAVTFLGAVPHNELLAALDQFDAIVLPTAGENFGHALIEGLAYGRPIFVPDTTPWTGAAIRSGTLVEDRSASSWTEAIKKFLELADEDLTAMSQISSTFFREWQVEHSQDKNFLEIIADSTNS